MQFAITILYGETLMRRWGPGIRAVAGAVGLICLAASPGLGAADVVRVGIAIDGPWERNDEIRGKLEGEVLALIRGEFDVRFPAAKRLEADWTLAGVSAVVDELLADPEVDILLAAGPISAAYVCQIAHLRKPVIALFVFSTDIQDVPFLKEEGGKGRSGVKNLNYVTFQHDLKLELQKFQTVVPFRKLAVLVSRGLYDAVPAVREWYEAELSGLGLEITYVRVAGSAGEALAALPAGVEAVYVGPLLELTTRQYGDFIAGLIERRLPSFAMWGSEEVEAGLLASFYLAADFDRLGRRVAMNMQRILLGEDPGEIPVVFRRAERLTINAATARAIGVYPSWSTLTDAVLFHEEPEGLERSLSLARAARQAVRVNLDLAAADRGVAAGVESVRDAQSRLRPQIEASVLGTVIDEDRAKASFGAAAERTVSAALTVSHLIYSDPARSNVDIQTHRQASLEQEREQLLLDIALEATVTYLNVLRAKTVERIQKDNLSVTRSNLELARARQAIGVARAAEINRWESDVAARRRAVLEAGAQRSRTRIALNRRLHRPLEEQFAAEPVDINDPAVMCNPSRMHPYYQDQRSWSLFRDFMVQEALAASPELRQLDASIAAQRRFLAAARRAFTHPTIALQGVLSARTEAGAGSASGAIDDLPMALPTADDVEWSIGLRAALPLADGGIRGAAERKAEEDLARLRLARQAAVERVEQRVRSALYDTGASFSGIELAQDAATAAGYNLESVKDAYARGAIPIVELIDAQNAALVADLAAANAEYDFIIDMMHVERAVGRFDALSSPDEREAFYRRVQDYFDTAAAPESFQRAGAAADLH
jgi:outer membrane protein TolC